MDNTPLVSVGIACFNGEAFLRDALDSVLNNSYKRLEILVMDDGSTDKSLQVARSTGDPRVKVLENRRNLGLVKTRQRIMSEAVGDYLVWLDQDDIAAKHRISRQVTFLEENPDYGVVGSWTIHRFLDDSRLSFRQKVQHLPLSPDEVRASVPFICPISFNTATMRVSSFRKAALGFRSEFGNALDYDLWSRAADVMSVGNLPAILGEYSIHSGQTSQGPASTAMLSAAWRIQREVLARNLGISIDRNFDRHIHYRLTLEPDSLKSFDDLEDIATWLELLRLTNGSRNAYDHQAFQYQLALQCWRGLWHVGKHHHWWSLALVAIRYRHKVQLPARALVRALATLTKSNSFLSWA